MSIRTHISRLFALAALAAASVVANADSFTHYEGVHGQALAANGMQQVHEYEYYYYINATNQAVRLYLPIEDNNSSEPMGYYRWYDYDTDTKSSYLSTISNTKLLSTDYGLFGGKFNSWSGNIRNYYVEVNYTLPSGTDLSTWEGDVIACDVSRYTDYNYSRTSSGYGYNQKYSYSITEPTLSTRYIYHILPASKIADDIVDAVCVKENGGNGTDVTYEDNKRLGVGLKDKDAKFTVRLNRNKIERYWFHPMTGWKAFCNKHVYHSGDDSKYAIQKSDFNTSQICQANSVYWRIYNEEKTAYCEFWNQTTRFLTKSLSDLESATWYDATKQLTSDYGYQTQVSTKPTFSVKGSKCYMVAYLINTDGTNRYCPVASYEVCFSPAYPMTHAELLVSNQTDRLLSSLEEHYTQAIPPISFDYDNSELDLSQPTSYSNNMSHKPSKWARRSYGFVYQDLSSSSQNPWYNHLYWPLHGEYGIYKSANVSGVSDTGSEMYWWSNSNVMYDRTYEMTDGKQYGSFLFFDASDESRKVAELGFEADLCAGSEFVFYGGLADMTAERSTALEPELMFSIYGVNLDENDNVLSRKLITSFTSGDMTTNKNTSGHANGKWHQVYGRTVLPKSSGVENFTDFQLEIINMCTGTNGADYAVDDIRLYRKAAIVDAIQSEALCDDKATSTNMQYKLRVNYEALKERLDNTGSTFYYRICKEDGTPLRFAYDGGSELKDYGTLTLPDYDASSDKFETDDYGEKYFIIANQQFNLEVGQDYYVSLAFYDATKNGPGDWGKHSNVCSSYSNTFRLLGQEVAISETSGSAVTTVRVSCTSTDINMSVSAGLKTVDPINGGTTTLNTVKFDWYAVELGGTSEFDTFKEALRRFRDAYPNATSLQSRASGQYTSADYSLLKTYVYDSYSNEDGKLVLSNSSSLTEGDIFTIGNQYTVYAIPVSEEVTVNGVKYRICTDTPFPFKMRVIKDGPQLTIGESGIVYPDDSRTVRMGLKQLDILKETGGLLKLPVSGISIVSGSGSDKTLWRGNGVSEMKIFISDTNDPTVDLGKTPVVGQITNSTITESSTVNMKFNDDAISIFHEGYWYELNFEYHQQNPSSSFANVVCPGETYIKFIIVPEFLTWNTSVVRNLNSNWNNDANWLRSTKAELFNSAYDDYDNLDRNGYVPMKFSKVTMPEQRGKVYPQLGYIQYGTGTAKIAQKMSNAKGEAATKNIEYDMMVTWNKGGTTYENHTDDGTNFSTELFYGNTCNEIYFKPHAELREPCYLIYDKAYVEKELTLNKWHLASSPLKDTYAGEFYVPFATGQQQTAAFKPITWDDATYSRAKYPIYQRNWDAQGNQVVVNGTKNAYDYAGLNITVPTELNTDVAYWSHVYNNVSTSYDDAKPFAIKAGDDYYPLDPDKTLAETAIIRLPKADESYSYYDYEGNASSSVSKFTVPTDRKPNELLVKKDVNTDGALSPITMTMPSNNHSDNKYYLIGNPYPASLSLYWFLKANTMFEHKVWRLEDGTMTAKEISFGSDDVYHRDYDVLIEPMEAFIVKLKDTESAPTSLSFTSRMNVDRWITTGSVSTTGTISLTADSKESSAKSHATVTLDDDATADYDSQRDVEALHQKQLGDIPTVYTVASDQALAVNHQPAIDWLPLGVVSDKDETVALSLTKENVYSRLYLYDAKARTFTELMDGETVDVQTNDHGRYFLTTTTAIVEPAKAESQVRCYSPAQGQLTVAANAAAEMQSISLYTVDGRKVAEVNVSGETAHTFQVAAGIHIAKVTLAGQPDAVTAKVNVR